MWTIDLEGPKLLAAVQVLIFFFNLVGSVCKELPLLTQKKVH